MKLVLAFSVVLASVVPALHAATEWPAPAATVIPEANGYIAIPNAACL